MTLQQSDEVDFSWHRGSEAGFGFGLDFFAGVEQEIRVSGGLIVEAEAEALAVEAGITGGLATNQSSAHETSVAASSALVKSDQLSLHGQVESEPHFPHPGRRSGVAGQ